jgi:hypothetical protein
MMIWHRINPRAFASFRRAGGVVRTVKWSVFAAAAVHLGQSLPAAAAAVDFDHDIRPILSDNCFKCHGPDEEARKAKLRLDQKSEAFRDRDGIRAIVPGSRGDSELITRIFSDDPDEVMPPPKSRRTLTAAQRELLARWIDEGAPWAEHWAFVPPDAAKTKSLLPANNRSDAGGPIDFFIARAAKQAGLVLAPPASRERFIRRVTLDLTGLPPTIDEIDAYLADNSSDATERLIDRLLASPRLGERMASDWLDVARFADTHGYQMDRFRPVWPYRDWVIRAFNDNMPFDRFIRDQLAGDLLPESAKEQRIATAFNRLHMQNEEGGIVEEEFRVAYVVDRVNTFGTAFLGLTLECARCHDHKFDPISQRDYYSLFAFFQNIDESGQTSYFTDATPVPTVLLSNETQERELAHLRTEIRAKENAIAQCEAGHDTAFHEWLGKKVGEPNVPGEIAAFDFDKIDGGKVANRLDPSKPGVAHDAPKIISGKIGNAAELDGENGFSFPGLAHFTRTDPFSIGAWVQAPELAARAVVLQQSPAPIDAGSRGYELILEDGHVAFGLHHMWPGNSLKIRSIPQIKPGVWTHLAVTYNGGSRAAGAHIYIDGKEVESEVVRDGLFKDITYAGGEPDLVIGNRFRDNGFKGGRIDDFRIFARALTALEVADIAGNDALRVAWKTNSNALRDYFFANVCAPVQALVSELKALRAAENKLVSSIPELMAMREMSAPKPAFILKRGAYDAPGEAVTANTPSALFPFPKNAPHNRLGLTQWVLDRANPLTARVTVNRLWQMMFGRGIVETSDNFGSQGAPPSHPELLDFLAVDFVESGWNIKALLRKIALSATYRRSALAESETRGRDPENVFLARGPARRLTAEMIRDQALSVSGLLVEKLGGPSVKPYQPAGLWEIAMGHPDYGQGHGDDLHRRSLYTFWKRTVPPPAMMTFDAADRSYCTVRRQSTSTPLQALASLNDTQLVEAARKLGERMLLRARANSPSLDAQIGWMFRTVTSRPATERELAILKSLFEEQRALFLQSGESAVKLIAVGEAKADPAVAPADLAAATLLAQAILNHDDALMRR